MQPRSFDEHPCFDVRARHRTGRIHLPVAPRCNIQCNFCDRKYDCVNESRPGVTSSVLSPAQALVYLDQVLFEKPNIAVVGIAGPGDPFANPDETLATLHGVRERYPDMILCVASNGLNVLPYVDNLRQIGLSHITITVNAVDPVIGAQVCAWVRYNKRVWAGEDGASLLLGNQLAAIEACKEAGLIVKVNCVILSELNDQHVPALAQRMAELRVDILNCIPYYPNMGAKFGNRPAPSPKAMNAIRRTANRYLPQMQHCARCRADDVGLIGEAPDPALRSHLRACASMVLPEKEIPPATKPRRPYIAVASLEGMLVNQHLGEADVLYIYENGGEAGLHLREIRATPPTGGGAARWEALAAMLSDCRAVLVSGIGSNPRTVLEKSGLDIFVLNGVIAEAVQSIFTGQSVAHLIKPPPVCGAECGGTGSGCG
jgi:nitrogen fixation protein NifB